MSASNDRPEVNARMRRRQGLVNQLNRLDRALAELRNGTLTIDVHDDPPRLLRRVHSDSEFETLLFLDHHPDLERELVDALAAVLLERGKALKNELLSL